MASGRGSKTPKPLDLSELEKRLKELEKENKSLKKKLKGTAGDGEAGARSAEPVLTPAQKETLLLGAKEKIMAFAEKKVTSKLESLTAGSLTRSQFSAILQTMSFRVDVKGAEIFDGTQRARSRTRARTVDN